MSKTGSSRVTSRLLQLAVVAVLAAVVTWLVARIEKFAVWRSGSPPVALKYPVDWIVVANPQPNTLVSFVSPKEGDVDTFQENVNIAIDDLARRPVSFEQFSSETIKAVESSFDNGRVAESERTFVAGVPGYRYSFETKQKDEIRMLLVWFIKSGKAYTVTYTGKLDDYEGYLDEVETMIRSLTVD